MNSLFVGPYRQNDGWGAASRDYIKAISTQIPYLSTRPIYYTNNHVNEIDKQIKEYESSLYSNYDIVFQKCLPHSFTVDKKIKKNVGITMLETNDISRSVSINIINQLDEILVPSSQEAKCLKLSGVNIPIKIISQPIDVNFYHNNIDYKLDLSSTLDKTFKFYTIGEFIERKNLLDLVLAFHLAFEDTDKVSLILKTNHPAADSKRSLSIIKEEIENLKKKMNIRQRYKNEIIITDRLTDKDMVGLHNSCDCFVMPSCGESFCRPAAEALILGKTPIVTDNTGMVDFINSDNGYIVNSRKCPVLLNQRSLSNDFDIYNAYEYWYKPNIYHLAECMVNIYNLYKKDKKSYDIKKQKGINAASQFSYENIGKKICA